ncbi:MAG TPA: aminoglycoside phosphotransferase family protein [Pyrinomonadaceae bacterium]|jgi:aminoglycoside phosphotransferase (APT) family kinase protein
MSQNAANALNDAGAPSEERLINAVRRGLRLNDSVPVELNEVTEFSNINYVYRVEVPGRSLYLKVVPERPKRFPARLPRERVFSEAEGLRRFRSLVGGAILIPEVHFVDEEEMAFVMSDVGEGREVLFSVLNERFELLGEQAEQLGQALGAVHGGTRGSGSPRPALEEAIIRKVVFDGLLAPGARQVFPDMWEAVSTEMQAHNQCLIHADLWSKNLLVRQGEPVAVVDFEGICYGDPAFDLGTLIAVALLPALDRPALFPDALSFTDRLLHAWTSRCGSEDWIDEVLPRAFRATATFLATRGFGPFAYSMSEAGRQRVAQLSRSLAAETLTDMEAFRTCVHKHADSASRPTGAAETTG